MDLVPIAATRKARVFGTVQASVPLVFRLTRSPWTTLPGIAEYDALGEKRPVVAEVRALRRVRCAARARAKKRFIVRDCSSVRKWNASSMTGPMLDAPPSGERTASTSLPVGARKGLGGVLTPLAWMLAVSAVVPSNELL